MSKIHITSQGINAIFGKYDDCSEEPIECATRARTYMKELLSTKSIPKNREEKTSRLLETLKQNINEAKRSQEASALDPNSIIMSEKRKMDEQNLRLTLTKTKEWLNSLVEYQRLESRSLRYAAVASALAVLISVGATYGLSIFYPLNSWFIGYYTWGIGITVSLIASFYVWRGLRFNSSPAQTAVAIIVAPIIVLITTTVIVLVGSALTSAIALTNSQVGFDTFFASQVNNDYNSLLTIASTNPTVIVGLLASIVVGLVLAFAAGSALQKIIGLQVFRNQTKEPDETEDEI